MNINDFDSYDRYKRALLCANLCLLAYVSDIDHQFKRDLGVHHELIDKIANLKHKTIQYHLYETETHQFIVIRGTDTKFGYIEALSDLFVSLNFLPNKSNNGVYCHKGYSDIGNKIIEQLHKKKLLRDDKKLILSGHSLGGAIAKFISIHVKDVELYTYGSPQVSDKDYYVFNYSVDEFHFMNINDWICSYPSTLYNDDKTVYVLTDKKYERRKIKRMGIFLPFIYLSLRTLVRKYNCNILDDHAIKTYIKRIESVYKE